MNIAKKATMNILVFPNGNGSVSEDMKRLLIAYLLQLALAVPLAVVLSVAPVFAMLLVTLVCGVTGGYAIAQGKSASAPVRGLVVMVIAIAIGIVGAFLVRPVLPETPMDFERLLLVAAGMLIALAADWCLTLWRNIENRKAREEASAVLVKHGLSAHLYIPGMGVDDSELHHALDRFAFTGQVVIDQQGRMIGKLLPRAEKGAHLRLVVDNSN